MTSLCPVFFSKFATISLSGAAMPAPAMTWSSAATEGGAMRSVEPINRIALHAFIFSPLPGSFQILHVARGTDRQRIDAAHLVVAQNRLVAQERLHEVDRVGTPEDLAVDDE